MGNLELTAEEEKELLSFIERYYHDLRVEIANTDDREFRREPETQGGRHSGHHGSHEGQEHLRFRSGDKKTPFFNGVF